jgi:hypothetical protein
VSLAGDTLLDARLLSTAGVAATTATALAQGILSFVQKARHVVMFCEGVVVSFGVTRIGWREAKATRRQSRAVLYALELRLRVCCLRDSLIARSRSRRHCNSTTGFVMVATVGPATGSWMWLGFGGANEAVSGLGSLVWCDRHKSTSQLWFPRSLIQC